MIRWTTFTFTIVFILTLILLIKESKISNSSTYTIITENGDQVVGTIRNSQNQLVYLSNKQTFDEIANYLLPNCICDNSKEATNVSALSRLKASHLQSNISSSSQGPTTIVGDVASESSSSTDQSNESTTSSDSITIFVITPTYTRATQMADMTRLAQTLMLVKDVFWIIVEDSHSYSTQVRQLLERTKLPHVHLLGPRPKTHLDKRSGRGVSNRIAALDWLRATYTNSSKKGVVYFADDDNSYDYRIFDEMRDTQKVSIWPVGLLAKIGLSSPILDFRNGSVVGFHDPWITTRRKFAVDMAGFAFNLQLFLSKPKAKMPYKVGYEEDYFIRSLGVKMEELEPKANNCTEIMVWHTKTQPGTLPNMNFLIKEKDYKSTNLVALYKNILQA